MVVGSTHQGQARSLLQKALETPEGLRLAAEIPGLAGLVEHYYLNTSLDDLLGRDPADLVGAVVSHRQFARVRDQGKALISITTPSVAEDGWTCGHTVVEIVTDDMPFIVDSVTAALNQAGRTLNLVIHPIFAVRRDADGELLSVDVEAQDDSRTESWVHVEIDRESDPAVIASLEAMLRKVLEDVRAAVEDWPQMRGTAVTLATELEHSPPPTVDPAEVTEAVELLRWLAHNHYTFLGYREYDLVTAEDGSEALVSRKGSGFGVLRNAAAVSKSFAGLPPQVRAKASEAHVLVLTKANRRSTVHRPAYLDYVGVKRFDAEGRVVGERRFIGLLSSATYADSAMTIPVVRRTIGHAITLSGFGPGSHSARDLLQFCETYPRDELFQISSEQLLDTARSVLAIAERRQTRVFVREDDYGRFVSALVYLPRDRFTTESRLKIMAVLQDAYGSESIDFVARVSESILARLHFVVRMPAGVAIPEVDETVLTAQIRQAARLWDDEFADALHREVGEEAAEDLLSGYTAIPESYKQDMSARSAVADVVRLNALAGPGFATVHLHEFLGAHPDEHRFTLYSHGKPVALFDILPIFESLGAEILEERPYAFERADGVGAWIYDVGLRVPGGFPEGSEHSKHAGEFCDAFLAAWRGDCEVDKLNALVPKAGLTWREVAWVRSWVQYSRQLGSPFSYQYFARVINDNPDIAARLTSLFRARLDPSLGAEVRASEAARLDAEIGEKIDAVSSLDADRILRQLRGIVLAVLRTSAFQLDADGNPPVTVTIKVDPRLIPGVPSPTPLYEIWVSSPNISGVHLRFGKVARGGLRWSDRPEDMRTEILGLVKAQMVKNSVIVPVGSKGGFFVKRPRDPADRTKWTEDGIACYREFITGMLSVTDNLVEGEVVAPELTVRIDDDDPYLVVAADKGTAAFSDIANEISLERGYWLGDAFASGGSNGYDHKEMGITAKGAWESVKRHFRDMGVDTQTEPFTVAGIGDMSGDVFGNGMLLSEQIELVAAFDHRHVFLDPSPSPAESFVERARLAALPRSSWEDYDPSLISPGGGVFPRTLKLIPISDEVRESLGLDAAVTAMTPDDLVRSILLAPVDLLWNGGIGTYVKSAAESDSAVGDKANDAVRVNGGELRCKVVGEGGNLGLTQDGRIEAARIGVRLNTDAIDNSAGVDCSDHEVNIKIVLDAVVAGGELTAKQRNEFLAAMTDEVAADVLATNYAQNQVLGNARRGAQEMLPVHRRMINYLEKRGLVDRSLENLPSDRELAELQADGQGLTSPELCVLLSWVKIGVTQDLTESTLADEPWFDQVLRDYFPDQLTARYGSWLERHPLRREIISTMVANVMVDTGGLTFVFRAMEETGASVVEVARAYTVARDVFELSGVWDRISALDGQIPTQAQGALFLEARRLLDRATRWVLSLRGGTVDVEGEVGRFSETVHELRGVLPRLLVGGERLRLAEKADQLIALGSPEDIAYEVAGSLEQFSLLDIHDIALRYDAPTVAVAEVYFAVSEHYGIDHLLVRISNLPREDRWANLARASVRSDLYSVLAGLTSKVLRSTSADEVAESRIAQWEERSSEGQQRARATLAEIEAAGEYDLATLSVALRVLRTLVQQGAGINTPTTSASDPAEADEAEE